MKYKHDVSAKIRVFLSSSMAGDPNKVRREAIISYFDRLSLYHLDCVEKVATPDEISKNYADSIRYSDIMIMVLKHDIRPAVQREFDIAMENKKRVFAFILSGSRKKNLKDFIRLEVERCVTHHEDISKTTVLIDKIEESLLEDLTKKYVRLYEENLVLQDRIDRQSGSIKSDEPT